MKKIVKYLVAAFAMVAAVSCQEELALNEKPAQNSGKPVFSASLNNLNTKTVLEEESMKTLWTGGEWINVMDFEGVNNIYSTPARQEPAQTVDFSFKEGGSFYGKSVFAMYPYNEDNVFWSEHDAFGFTVNHPVEQTAAVGTFDTFGPVHVAYNADFEADNSLDFKNLSALIKFTVTDPGVKKITFYGLEGERVSGPVTYRYDNGNYVIEDTYNAYDYVELKAPAGQYLEMGKNYYIAVVPGTFESGVAIEVNNHLENKITYKHEGKVTLRPNTINNFGSFETMGDLTWELVGKFNSWAGGAEFTKSDETGMFYIKDVKLTDDTDKVYTEFKIRGKDEKGWNDDANYGFGWKQVLEAGTSAYLVNGGNTSNIFALKGTYDIWFDPFGMMVYMLPVGGNINDIKDAPENPQSPRYVTGSFNDWNGLVPMTWNSKDGWYEAVVEVTEDMESFEFKINIGNCDINYGAQDGYTFADGVEVYTSNDGANFTIPTDEPGYYVIQQNYDGTVVKITSPETPDLAQWDFSVGTYSAMMDFGIAIEDHFLWGLDVDKMSGGAAPEYMSGLYQIVDPTGYGTYKFVPTGLKSGKLVLETETYGTMDNYMTYTDFDGKDFTFTCPAMGGVVDAVATLATEEHEIYVDFSPVGKQMISPDGMYVYDFGYTIPGQLVIGEYGPDKDGEPCAIYYDETLQGVPFNIEYTSLTSGIITYRHNLKLVEIEYNNNVGPRNDPNYFINVLSESNGWFAEGEDEDGNIVFDYVRARFINTSLTPALEFIPFKPVEISVLGKQWLGFYENEYGRLYTFILDLSEEGVVSYSHQAMDLEGNEYFSYLITPQKEFVYTDSISEVGVLSGSIEVDGHLFEFWTEDGEELYVNTDAFVSFGEEGALFINNAADLYSKDMFFSTPNFAQWIFDIESGLGNVFGYGPVRTLLDLGVHDYSLSLGKAGANQFLSMGVSYKDLGCPSYVEMGLTLEQLGLTEEEETAVSEIFVRVNYTTYVVDPIDNNSGDIYQAQVDEYGAILGDPILFASYEEFDGETAKFDFAPMFGEEEPMFYEAAIADKYHYIIPQ